LVQARSKRSKYSRNSVLIRCRASIGA
jgi:hypothetical protein